MKKYFYSDGTHKHGPFTLQELKEELISKDTLIWFEGLSDWTPASKIEEIISTRALIPPPIPKNNGEISIHSKERHWVVPAWLVYGITVNSAFSLFYLFSADTALMNLDILLPTDSQKGAIIYLGILSSVNIFLYVLLFKWKKIGFYGFIVTGIFALMLNLSVGYDIIWSLFGVIGVIILYYILQIKKNGVSTWQQLEKVRFDLD